MPEVKTGSYTRLESFSAQAGRNFPRFFTETVEGQAMDGRKTFKEEEFVEIIMPVRTSSEPAAWEPR